VTAPPAALGDRGALAATVGTLALYDVLRSTVIPDGAHFATNVLMVAVLALLAAAARTSAAELGLARRHAGVGVRLGLLVTAAIALVVAVAAALGDVSAIGTDPSGLEAVDLWLQVLVEIPLATVLFEELAFRGLLTALLERLTAPTPALLWQSALFGLWHVPGAFGGDPPLDSLPGWLGRGGLVVATVAATAIAGALFHLLRRRSSSLVAPALAHWATNGVALAVVWAITQ
jgi:membrane protease YdiL (CAAX protease family)